MKSKPPIVIDETGMPVETTGREVARTGRTVARRTTVKKSGWSGSIEVRTTRPGGEVIRSAGKVETVVHSTEGGDVVTRSVFAFRSESTTGETIEGAGKFEGRVTGGLLRQLGSALLNRTVLTQLRSLVGLIRGLRGPGNPHDKGVN